MRKKSVALILLCLLLSSAIEARHARNVVVVKVLDFSGKPLKHACVTLVPKEGEIIFRNADGKGVVTVKDLEPGKYRVTAKVEGFVAEKQEITIEESGSYLVMFSLDAKS
ncbi:MAG: carboxypeptidase regulatory-like domain-containing protein [Acidobacteria bacterium]|nr:carboxypeptidase regulatory-like domain-containing protein [Acidobacteriota bacterium]